MRNVLLAAVSISALALSSSQPLVAQGEADQQLGNVHFETSCNEVAQRRFDRAMRYQHSFWYAAAQELFEEAAKADPQCGIAYWGVALSLLANPHGAIPAPNLATGARRDSKGKAIGGKTDRERDFIDALTLMYVDYDKLPQPQRMRAYLGAMEKLATKYPNDDEAQIFYAITLNTSASPADKTYAQQLKGAAILEPIWKRQPQHPGIAHYLIHLYDYPPIAEKGLGAAKLYAQIAPAAPHAQHMPSHIFTRVGYWQDSIASNTASAKAAEPAKEFAEQFHARDYMVYAYLQLGRDGDARRVVDYHDRGAGPGACSSGAFFALAASPARYAIERGDWKSCTAELKAHTERVQRGDGDVALRARARRRAVGKPEAAKEDIAKLTELRDKLQGGEGRLLVRDRRHPAPDRGGLGARRRGQEG